jgi:CRP/FNR family transcriptional regulator, cyclic AMP receptor protein
LPLFTNCREGVFSETGFRLEVFWNLGRPGQALKTLASSQDSRYRLRELMSSIEMTLSEQIRMLSGADFLEPLSEQQLEKLAARCPDIFYKQGEILSTPDEIRDDGFFYIVKQGRVRIYELGPGGHEHTLTEIRDGTAFAAQRLNGVYAQAMEQTILVILRREDLKHLIGSCPEVGVRFIEALIKSLRASESRSADIALREVPARLASLLLELVEAGGVVISEGYKLPTHYTHERLGSMIGATREAVTRGFGRLQYEGAVELRRRLIYIKDIEGLHRIAGR